MITSDFPLSKTGIIVVKLPLTNSNPSVSRISQTVTLVALDGPLLVTIIVKVTLSPTKASSVFTIFTTVKLTTGITLTDTLPPLTVAFSFDVTLTTLVKVPLVTALRVIVNT